MLSAGQAQPDRLALKPYWGNPPYGISGRARETSEPLDDPQKDLDVLIAALKKPAIGRSVRGRLWKWGRRIELLTTQLRRSEFLNRLNHAKVRMFLPNTFEGFYLPALEGMALGTIVVCPDCVANRSFCLPGENCFRPAYDVEQIVEAAETALRLAPDRRCRMLERAFQTAAQHDLREERKAFLDILQRVPELWAERSATRCTPATLS